MRRITICNNLLNNTQAVYNCEYLAFTVKTVSVVSQATCKNCKNVEFRLINSAFFTVRNYDDFERSYCTLLLFISIVVSKLCIVSAVQCIDTGVAAAKYGGLQYQYIN